MSSSIAGLTYIPDFITEEEEEDLLREIDAREWDSGKLKRRTQSYGTRYHYRKHSVSEMPPIPDFMLSVVERLLPHLSADTSRPVYRE